MFARSSGKKVSKLRNPRTPQGYREIFKALESSACKHWKLVWHLHHRRCLPLVSNFRRDKICRFRKTVRPQELDNRCNAPQNIELSLFVSAFRDFRPRFVSWRKVIKSMSYFMSNYAVKKILWILHLRNFFKSLPSNCPKVQWRWSTFVKIGTLKNSAGNSEKQ